MANASDKVEKKVFNIVRNVCLVGPIYGFIRSCVYIHKKKYDEAQRCANVDLLAQINPVKNITNVLRNVVNAFGSEDEGVWVGYRPIAWNKNPYGIAISPGIDVHHYAVMIRGIVYQISAASKDSYIQVDIYGRESTEKDTFTWTSICQSNDSIAETDQEIMNYAKHRSGFNGSKYHLTKKNCQDFVKAMLCFTLGYTDDLCEYKLLLCLGNILF